VSVASLRRGSAARTMTTIHSGSAAHAPRVHGLRTPATSAASGGGELEHEIVDRRSEVSERERWRSPSACEVDRDVVTRRRVEFSADSKRLSKPPSGAAAPHESPGAPGRVPRAATCPRARTSSTSDAGSLSQRLRHPGASTLARGLGDRVAQGGSVPRGGRALRALSREGRIGSARHRSDRGSWRRYSPRAREAAEPNRNKHPSGAERASMRGRAVGARGATSQPSPGSPAAVTQVPHTALAAAELEAHRDRGGPPNPPRDAWLPPFQTPIRLDELEPQRCVPCSSNRAESAPGERSAFARARAASSPGAFCSSRSSSNSGGSRKSRAAHVGVLERRHGQRDDRST
jgi:hypothetical protein